MVVVPAGSFEMGSAEAETTRETVPAHLARRERLQHGVTIAKPFAVGRHEVTREQYERFAADTGRAAGDGCTVWTGTEWRRDLGKSWRDPGFVQPVRDPVVCVTWNDAKAYAEWLSRKTGKPTSSPQKAARMPASGSAIQNESPTVLTSSADEYAPTA